MRQFGIIFEAKTLFFFEFLFWSGGRLRLGRVDCGGFVDAAERVGAIDEKRKLHILDDIITETTR